MKFTKEEISLCKQVAKRHRKYIKKGAWIIQEERADIPLLVIDTEGTAVILNVGYETKTEANYEDCVLLWTISDCLEFLYGKYEEVGVDSEENKTDKYWESSVYLHREGNEDLNLMSAKGKTPLEACLKVVLVVLEEETK